MIRSLGALLLVLALPITLVLAQPADPDLPQPDPPGVWRALTHDDTTTTSRCIGDPKTPLCALETHYACHLRALSRLCRAVEDSSGPPSRPAPAQKRQEYRVVSARRLTTEVPPDPVKEWPHDWQTGDVLIAVFEKVCYDDMPLERQCSIGVENEPPHHYLFRNKAGRWVSRYRYQERY